MLQNSRITASKAAKYSHKTASVSGPLSFSFPRDFPLTSFTFQPFLPKRLHLCQQFLRGFPSHPHPYIREYRRHPSGRTRVCAAMRLNPGNAARSGAPPPNTAAWRYGHPIFEHRRCVYSLEYSIVIKGSARNVSNPMRHPAVHCSYLQ